MIFSKIFQGSMLPDPPRGASPLRGLLMGMAAPLQMSMLRAWNSIIREIRKNCFSKKKIHTPPPPPRNFFYTNFFFYVGNNMKREENLKYWKKKWPPHFRCRCYGPEIALYVKSERIVFLKKKSTLPPPPPPEFFFTPIFFFMLEITWNAKKTWNIEKKKIVNLFFSIFKKFIKNSNSIPSISKTIQHTPMTWCT